MLQQVNVDPTETNSYSIKGHRNVVEYKVESNENIS